MAAMEGEGGAPVLQEWRVAEGRVVVLRLNRPERRNALNQEMVEALTQTFRRLKADASVRAVVLTGQGKAFCAGIDLTSPVNAVQQASDEAEDISHNPVRAMEAFDRPIIGAINGSCVTGGFELALACDFLVGSPNASFRDTHAAVGVVPCWGLSQKLSRIIGPGRARAASLSAMRIDAKTAERWGILVKVTLHEDLLDECVAMATASADLNPDIVEQYTRTLRDGFGLPLSQGLALERERALRQYGGLGQAGIGNRAGSFHSKL
uniref:Enoyl-CoA hydratase n=1 Tax=Rhizochromulina marina TaxID=1034831 RepID=A0A7S2RZI9_9STRA